MFSSIRAMCIKETLQAREKIIKRNNPSTARDLNVAQEIQLGFSRDPQTCDFPWNG